ncbi:hypothetical protein ANN_09807 [Periplaneta americana]|uniref:Zinc finger BED domain-containing protein 5 n=1 Tax=Periplaneta americana TaxID=6978 RepID=A0ABQ8TQB6_PERAM|nr:hypothetical protein ANN_09807 [Periplaneta americana]
MLIRKPLPANATGSEIFRLVSEYFEENHIPWDNCVHVCTDGAKTMVGKTVGAVSCKKSNSCANIFNAENKIRAFKKKLQLWMRSLGGREFESFPAQKDLREEDEETLRELYEINEEFVKHLENMCHTVEQYFPEQESENNSQNFLRREYPVLSKKAILILLPIVSTYLCETGFSVYTSIKTKYRNRLDAEPDMRLQLSNIKPETMYHFLAIVMKDVEIFCTATNSSTRRVDIIAIDREHDNVIIIDPTVRFEISVDQLQQVNMEEKKIYELVREWRKLQDTELHALYSSPDVIRNIKSRCLRWAGHVASMGESRNAYIVLVGRSDGKRPLGRPRRRWEDNIKMDLREVGYDDREWINLAQDRDQWRAYVRAAMNLRFLKNQETQDQATNVSKENDAQNYGRITEGENPKCDTVPTSRYTGHHTCSHYMQMEMGWTRGQATRRQMDIPSYHVGPPHRKETSRQISSQMGRLLQRTGRSTVVQRQKKVETTRGTFCA